MVEGNFVDSDKPVVQAVIAWNQSVQTPFFILDTGFTGDLVVTPEVATELGLDVNMIMPTRLPGNRIVNMRAATAIAVMEGKSLYVTVHVADGWPLLGISFMQKFNYKAIVDCKNKKVRLEVAV
jgi:predicted aspartyl protease